MHTVPPLPINSSIYAITLWSSTTWTCTQCSSCKSTARLCRASTRTCSDNLEGSPSLAVPSSDHYPGYYGFAADHGELAKLTHKDTLYSEEDNCNHLDMHTVPPLSINSNIYAITLWSSTTWTCTQCSSCKSTARLCRASTRTCSDNLEGSPSLAVPSSDHYPGYYGFAADHGELAKLPINSKAVQSQHQDMFSKTLMLQHPLLFQAMTVIQYTMALLLTMVN